MRLLLDTHIYLWSVSGSQNLSKKAKSLIIDADEVFVSSASIWEASIKASLGKLDVDIEQLVMEIEASGFQTLSVTTTHAARVRQLPDIHRDPFDRLLISQAQCEPLQLLTADKHLSQYSELVIVV